MPITPEDLARENIDRLLIDAGWIVQDKRATNLSAGRGVAAREFPLKSGHGEADYLLLVDGAPIGVVEAKKEGDTLTGVELQTTKYSKGVPDNLTTPRRPLPFQYQSTGVETRYTNLLEPDARSRRVFGFHRPDTLDQWLTQELQHPGSTLPAKLRNLPELMTEGLRPAQIAAIRNLEKSLAADRPRALTQMASGGCKTFTAFNSIYRLIKHAGAKRILFLVDRSNIVVPDNVLFEGGAGETIRRELLKQADVHTLLRLPTGIFYAQGVKANVLFFDRKPASATPWTKTLWIYDFRTNEHFTLKTNPLKRADLADFVSCYNAVNRHERKETERFKSFSYEDLLKRDKVSLDIFWLKDEAWKIPPTCPTPT